MMIYTCPSPVVLTKDVKKRILQRIGKKGKSKIGDNLGQNKVINKR